MMEQISTMNREIDYSPTILGEEPLIKLYKDLTLPRMIEEKMISQLKQGKVSKWFSGIGQEAISVGVANALNEDEYILPMHRNLGIFTTRGIKLEELFAQFQGKTSGFTQGHDRSFHFGSKKHHIVGMISHLGPQLGIADGIALASKLSEEGKATFVFTGDGGASEGDFHESINVAAVWQLPVIFGIENNSWGLSTPSSEQFRCEYFIDKAKGYGIPEEDAILVDGNNIVDVVEKVSRAAESIRKNPRPIMMEFMTYRLKGHEEASGTKYYPPGEIDSWEKKDPVRNFETWMLEREIISKSDVEEIKRDFKQKIEVALKTASAEAEVKADTKREISRVYKAFENDIIPAGEKAEEMRFIDAIHDGLKESMREHPNLVLMGQDIAEYGGVFKVTEGFVDEFGKSRVRNTPLCESAIIGTGIGLSIKGKKAMVEMQFADFVTCGFNQIINNAAKLHYRWEENVDLVIRMPTGAGVGAGPFHSQSNEAWFFHTPGLKIAYPAFPYDAKGLLCQSFQDPNPVLFFEHKALYRDKNISGMVPTGHYTLPFGVANVVQEGTDCTIVSYGLGVHWALKETAAKEVSADIIDLRTLLPLDMDTIYNSVRKTGKVIVLHEDCLTGGIGGEIVARIQETCFEHLDAPVLRCASLDTPVPFAAALESDFLASSRLSSTIDQLLAF